MCRLIPYREFESLSLRHKNSRKATSSCYFCLERQITPFRNIPRSLNNCVPQAETEYFREQSADRTACTVSGKLKLIYAVPKYSSQFKQLHSASGNGIFPRAKRRPNRPPFCFVMCKNPEKRFFDYNTDHASKITDKH